MNSQEQPAIIVKNVSKSFKLPHDKQSSIKGAVINIFRRKKSFEAQKVLNKITIDINKGEFVGIVGRNGSGKSTLLKLLAGIYSPDKGDVAINGSLVPFIELGVGFNQELTGRENVYLNGSLLGFDRKAMSNMYDEIVEFAELEKFMDQKLKNYSSGMQVRLAFSIAIRANSDILILDEVLAVGDANFQKKCYDYFQELKDKKKTVILVSHDMESVKRFANRAILLEDGQVIADGDPEKISDKYNLRNIKRLRNKEGNKKNTKIIKKVKFLSSADKEMQTADTNEEIAIEVDYDATSVKGELNFGVGMHLATGGYVFSYNTKMDGISIDKKKGTIRLKIEKLPLLKGDYFINIICFGVNEALPYDFVSKAAYIFISPSGSAGSYRGIVNIDHAWGQR